MGRKSDKIGKILKKEIPMKAFIAMITLFAVMSVQAATISAKAMLGCESRIENQRVALQEKLNSLEDTGDITEGKIVASIVNMVYDRLVQAEEALLAIDSDEKLTVEAIDAINKILDESEELIREI